MLGTGQGEEGTGHQGRGVLAQMTQRTRHRDKGKKITNFRAIRHKSGELEMFSREYHDRTYMD